MYAMMAMSPGRKTSTQVTQRRASTSLWMWTWEGEASEPSLGVHPSPGHGQQSDLPARTVGFQLPGVPRRQGVALLYAQHWAPMGPRGIVSEDWGFLMGSW